MALDHRQEIDAIKVIIGEEGAVIAFFSEDMLQNKLFVKSANPADTEELGKILEQNKDAVIEVYLDVLDQNYLQRMLPGVDRFSIKRLANKRLEKETPLEHLKFALQVDRVPSGRKDWIYTFISAAYEPPVSSWMDYLMNYDNIVIGLYFLPVEAASIVNAIHHHKAGKHDIHAASAGPLDKLKSAIGSIFSSIIEPLRQTFSKGTSWDILMLNNKTGGVRQVAYQNNRVVFTRLLNNIADSNPDVVAGNIEQELNNAMEYLRRLSLKPESSVAVHIICSEDVKRNIRTEKIPSKNVNLFTPYELVEMFNLKGNVSKEQDRFAEPVTIALLQQDKRRLARLHTKAMRTAYYMYYGTQALAKLSLLAVPVVILFAAILLWSTSATKNNTAKLQQNEAVLVAELDNLKQQKITEEGKFSKDANVPQLKEVVKVYKELSSSSLDVVNMVMEVANTDRQNTRVRSFDFSYNFTGLIYDPNAVTPTNPMDTHANKEVSLKAKILFSNKQGQYEELLTKYQTFKTTLTKKFPDYKVHMGDIPNTFSLDQIPDEVLVDLSIDNMKNTK
ncbi:MAG: hypothetical protein JSS50_00130 [Proteobacteria bacterium]|nr:hypothetical protein [Pseudomonadota bacterium]